MEVSIRREDLTRGLYLVQGVVERRSTVPILANVLLDPTEGGISFTATDMAAGLRVRVPAAAKNQGAVTVNARKLYAIGREGTAEARVLTASTAGRAAAPAGRSKY